MSYSISFSLPVKQFIIHLNDKKVADKKFIIEDLDSRHLLIKGEVKDEIERKVAEWMDEVRKCQSVNVFLSVYILCVVDTNLSYTSRGNKQNVYSTIERVGESLDTS